MAKRLMVYDRTCRGATLRPGLSHAWWAGARLYRGLGRFDAYCGVTSWSQALAWIEAQGNETPISEIQFWGHGKWGQARVCTERLDAEALQPGHPLHRPLLRVRDRLAPEGSLWWFRTCETLGAQTGHEFAQRFSDTLGCRVAGHTFIIGHWQSGLHSLSPGTRPQWSADEGLVRGTPDAPIEAAWSRWRAPHTISCLHGTIPDGY